ncbi:hypothetical protein U9M48_039325 [Paspalum notatum var. saurae]|uniref:Uncharacterized protein n=1 Tax=Paspalum notatum var. saurae TaxID=547442 RepID=A0AAQ3UL61_PASNO
MAADDAPENDGVPAPAVLPPPLEQTDPIEAYNELKILMEWDETKIFLNEYKYTGSNCVPWKVI